MIGCAFKNGIKLTRANFDVTNPEQIKKKIFELKPTAIVHLANIDLRHCERDPLLALKTNIHATQYLIREAKKHDLPLMFISSSCIFNGVQGSAFDETAVPEPQNFYSEAKVISEEMLLDEYASGAIIVRTSWVFGGHGAHHLKFVDVAINKCLKNETVFAGKDNDGSPTYVSDLVSEMTKLILSARRGVFHVANSGRATPWQIADFIRTELGSQSNIEPLQPSEIDKKIKRSSCEVLSSKYIQLRDWQSALREYVQHKIKKL